MTTPIIWPTTPLQRGLLSTPAPYVGQARIALSAPLAPATLARAAAALLRHYPQLGAGFIVDADVEPTQFITAVDPRIRSTSLGEVTAAEAQAQVAAIAAAEAGEGFDLSDPPLLRWHLIAAGCRSVLLLTAHHAVLDAWSMPLLLSEFARLGSSTPGPAPQTCDYSEHLAQLHRADRSAAAAFWADELAHLPEMPRPQWLGSESAAGEGAGAARLSCESTFSPGRTAALAARARDMGTTPAALLRGCVSLAVDWLSGAVGTPIVIPVHGRGSGLAGVENTPGLFTDSVLAAHCAAPGPLAEVLSSLETAWNAGLPHHHIGLSGILRTLGIADPAGVLYTHETAGARAQAQLRDADSGDIELTLVDVVDATHYPVEVTSVLSAAACDAGEGSSAGGEGPSDAGDEPSDAASALSIRVEVASHCAAGSERRLLTAVETLLSTLLEDPHRPLSSIDLRTDEDRRIQTSALGGGTAEPGEAGSALIGPGPAEREPLPRGPAGSGQAGAEISGAPPAPSLLPEAFFAACAAHPEKPALISDDQTLTFSELAAQVTARRAQLQTAVPVRTGRRRPLCALQLPRSVEAITALLASLTAGFTTLVLDPQTPARRREEVLDELAADLLLDPTGLVLRAAADPNSTAGSAPGTPADRPVTGTDTAFVVLTSGSTGRPKPVAVPHDAMAALLAHHRRQLWTEDVEVIAHTNALHFDAHWDALLGLFEARTVRLLDTQTLLDPHALAALLNRERIDYLDLGPALWASHLAAGLLTTLPAVCVAGGEAFPPQLWTQMRQLTGCDTTAETADSAGSAAAAAPGDTPPPAAADAPLPAAGAHLSAAGEARPSAPRVLNAYGPTENTVDAFIADVRDSAQPRVGRVVGGTTAAVLDPWLRPVAVGCEGELYLGGTQLAHGYLGRPALTAERFTAAPGGARLYRTGDRAWIDPAGSLALLGRADDQLSINGFRIEPGEITAALTRLPGIRHAHAAAVDHPSGGRRLVAWVQPEPQEPFSDPEAVRRGLRELLPPPLIPSAVLSVDAFPLTSSAKIDVRALPLPVWARPGNTNAADAGSATASAAAAVCEATAQVIGRADARLSLRSLGGDSISAIRVSAWLRRSGWALEAGALLSADTLAEAAAAAVPVVSDAPDSTADIAPAGGEVPAAIEIPAELRAVLPAGVQVSEKLPLSGTLTGMFAMSMRAGAADPYRTATLLRVEADTADQLTQPRVEAAWDAVLAAHPALRSVIAQGSDAVPAAFTTDPGRMVHHVIDAADAATEPADLDALRTTAVERAISEQSLADGHLICAVWLRLPQRSAADPVAVELALGVHHLLADGWTTPLLAESFEKALRGEPLPVDTGWAQYLRWCAAQDTSEWEAEWRELFRGPVVRTIVMPAAGTEASGQASATGQVGASEQEGASEQPGAPEEAGISEQARRRTRARAVWQPDACFTAAMQTAAQRMDITQAAAIQAAWARALSETTGAQQVVFDLTSAGRDVPIDGIERAVGAFLTTRPVLADASIPADRLCTTLMRQTARTERAAHLGGGAIAGLTGTASDSLLVIEAAHASIAGRAPGQESQAGLPRVVPVRGADASGYPVTLTRFESPDGPAFELELDAPGAAAAAAEALLARFARQLTAVLGLPSEAGDSEFSSTQESPAGLVAGDLVSAERVAAGPSAADPVPADRDVDPSGTTARVQREHVEQARRVMAAALGASADALAADDDFFASGGDSILVMSVVGALRRAGCTVEISDIFDARTPAALAARISFGTPATAAEAVAEAVQPVPLTPALRWYAAHIGDSADHFLQLRTLRIPADLTDSQLRRALHTLVSRHEALRLRLRGTEACVLPAERLEDGPLFSTAVAAPDDDLSALRAAAAALDPAAGRLLTAVRTRADRLVLIAHHLGVDAVSWPVLIAELRAVAHGEQLPPAESFCAAALALDAAADQLRPQAHGVRALFDRMQAADGAPAPEANAPQQLSAVGAARQRTVRLSRAATAALLHLAAAGTPVDVQLAAAVARTADTGLVVEFEGHGRPLASTGDPRDHIDFASVVGWFTQTWPVPLPPAAQLNPAAHLRSCASRCATLTAFADALALTGAAEDIRADLLVNFLGREGSADTSPAGEASADWTIADGAADCEDALGSGRSLPASHPWELNAGLDGEQLVLRWQCADPALDDAAVDARIAAVAAALEDSANPGICAGHGPDPGRTVGDPTCDGDPDLGFGNPVLDLVGATAPQLARLQAEGVDGLWPLTAAQTGIALESLGDEHGRYLARTDLELTGPIDIAALQRAATAVAAGEPALRMRLTQLGNRHVLASLAQATPDFRVFTSHAAAEAWLAEPFDVTSDPLTRWAFVHGSAGTPHRLALLDHHLVLDGWSVPLLVDALFTCYRAELESAPHGRERAGGPQHHRPTSRSSSTDRNRGTGRSALSAHPLTRHILIRQARGQNHHELQRWDAALPRRAGALISAVDSAHATLSAPLPACIASAARRLQLSQAEAVTAAWTALLAAVADADEVITGMVVSGRSHTDAETIGMLLQTVPVGACFGGQNLGSTLTGLTAATRLALTTPEAPLTELARRRSAPTLFDTLIVVENYPTPHRTQVAPGVQLGAVDGSDDTHYPLALTVEFDTDDPRDQADRAGVLRLDYPSELIDAQTAESLLAGVSAALQFLHTAPAEAPSGELIAAVRAVLAPTARALTATASGTGPASGPDPATASGPAGSQTSADAFAAVTEALTDALGRRLEPEDDFFSLGGDSLTAMAVITALRAAGWKLTAAQVFTHPTPRAMASAAAPLETPEPSREASPAVPDAALDAAGHDALAALLAKIEIP